MISADTAKVIVDELDAARECAAEIARMHAVARNMRGPSIAEINLIAYLRSAADSFGLQLMPKLSGEQEENSPSVQGDSMSNGVNPKDAIGATKVPMGYFPPAALLYAALGLWNGDIKYDKYNWRDGGKVLASIYIDAVERHLALWKSGEEEDKSGVPHLGHVLAGLAILVDALEGGYLIDDRPKNQFNFGVLLDKWNARAPALIAQWRAERAARESARA